MREKTTNGQIIIVFTEHPVFGALLIPYIAEKSEDGTLQLIEQAFHISPEAVAQMSETERRVIGIASQYTEKYLMNLYSREKTVSRFLHKLAEKPELIKNDIRPFIEEKLQEMLGLIRKDGLPLYQKQAGNKTLYAHHAYHIHPLDAEVRWQQHIPLLAAMLLRRATVFPRRTETRHHTDLRPDRPVTRNEFILLSAYRQYPAPTFHQKESNQRERLANREIYRQHYHPDCTLPRN